MGEVFSWINQFNVKVGLFSVCLFMRLAINSVPAVAQTDTNDKIYQGIILDEVMVKAVQSGFDVQGFIQKVKQDTTFYKAFKTLRLLNYTMFNDIVILDREGEQKASYNSISRQTVQNHCRSMSVRQEKVTGDFFKRNRVYRYLTAKLYAHLFFTNGKVCNENNIVANTSYSGTEKYEEQLRILIFNPGRRIRGIPGIGEEMAIFDEPFFSKYKFRLSRQDYNGEPCYVFKALPLDEFKDEVVINELKTWFRVSDFAIMARDYSLSFRTLLYDFDVVMKVKLKTVAGQRVPYEIDYRGNWHVLTKSREIAKFTAIFTDFEE